MKSEMQSDMERVMFDEIIGNENLKCSLEKSIRNQKVYPAYVFCGPHGIGKKTFAKSFTKALQCPHNTNEITPCYSCLAFDSNNHPDVIYITTTKKSIGVDDIREQINISLMPYYGPYRVFIIQDVMTNSAQNALLKMLEEAPSYVVFIILSERYGELLSTIVSRCIVMQLKHVDADAMTKYLIEHDKPNEYGIYAQGNIGYALSFDDKFTELRRLLVEFLIRAARTNSAEAMLFTKQVEAFETEWVLEIMSVWYRDLIVLKQTGDTNLLLQYDLINEIQNCICDYDFEKLCAIRDSIQLTKFYLRHNTNFNLTMSMLFIKICRG